MWATAPRYSGRYSRQRMASPRPPGPLATVSRRRPRPHPQSVRLRPGPPRPSTAPGCAAVSHKQLGPEVRRARSRRARGSEGTVRAQHLHRRDHRAAGFAPHDPAGGPAHRDHGMRYRHLEPAGWQQPPGSGVEGPDRGHGGTDRPGLAGQLGRAEARAGRRAVGLPPSATTNTSPSSVTAAATVSGSGRWPVTAAVCRAGSTAWITVTGQPVLRRDQRPAPGREAIDRARLHGQRVHRRRAGGRCRVPAALWRRQAQHGRDHQQPRRGPGPSAAPGIRNQDSSVHVIIGAGIPSQATAGFPGGRMAEGRLTAGQNSSSRLVRVVCRAGRAV